MLITWRARRRFLLLVELTPSAGLVALVDAPLVFGTGTVLLSGSACPVGGDVDERGLPAFTCYPARAKPAEPLSGGGAGGAPPLAALVCM